MSDAVNQADIEKMLADINTMKYPELYKKATDAGHKFSKKPTKAELIEILTKSAKSAASQPGQEDKTKSTTPNTPENETGEIDYSKPVKMKGEPILTTQGPPVRPNAGKAKESTLLTTNDLNALQGK